MKRTGMAERIVTGRSSGFTLIEMLVVLGIAAILLVLIIPSFRGVSEANSLTSATANVAAELDFARQTALAQNIEVELRFYKVSTSDTPAGSFYNGIQTYRVSDGLALDKLQVLPSPIGIMDGATPAFSTIFASIASDTSQTLGSGNVASYKAIDFLAGGGTTLAASGTAGGDTWFLTLKNKNAPMIGTTSPGKNFITIQLDSVTGRTRNFQPY